MQMANMPAMSSPEVKTEAMPDVAASTQGNKRVSVEASQEPLNKKRKEEMNGQQQTVTQSASERQQSNDNARSRYEAPEPRFRRDSLSSRDARYGIRDRRDDHYDSRDRRDDHAESRDRRSSMSTPERRENNNERHDGQFNRRESNVPDRREGGESRPRHDLRERLESGATQRTANVIIYESVDSRARKDSVTSRPAETQPRPAATTPPEAPATAPEPVVTLKPETVVVTKQQPTATLADQFKDSQMTPVSNRTDTIVLEASPDDEEPGQVSEAPVVTSSWDHATTTTYSGWPQSPSPSKSVAGQTMSLDSSRRSSPARTVAATNAGSPSNITIQVSTSNNNDESVTREVALEPIGNSTQERRVIDTTSTQQRPFSRVPRSILDRLQSERKFSDREIIFEVRVLCFRYLTIKFSQYECRPILVFHASFQTKISPGS